MVRDLSGFPTYQDLAASSNDNFRIADKPGAILRQGRNLVLLRKKQSPPGSNYTALGVDLVI